MNALLLLLAMLSIASVISHLGHASLFVRFTVTPVLLTVGLVASPNVLSFLFPSTVQALNPALHFATAWLAFLLGLRTPRPTSARQIPGNIGTFFADDIVLWIISSAVAFGILSTLLQMSPSTAFANPNELALSASLLVGGLLIGREPIFRKLPRLRVHRVGAIATLSVLASLSLWPFQNSGSEKSLWMLAVMPFVIGLTCAVAESLLINAKKADATSSVIASLALTTLITGIAISMGTPAAPVGFIFGFGLSQLQKRPLFQRKTLIYGENPIRMVMLVLAGTYLELSITPFVLGGLLALSLHLTRYLIKKALSGVRKSKRSFSPMVGASEVAIPFAVSFAICNPIFLSFASKTIFTTIVVAGVASDLAAVLGWTLRNPRRKLPGQQPETGLTHEY